MHLPFEADMMLLFAELIFHVPLAISRRWRRRSARFELLALLYAILQIGD